MDQPVSQSPSASDFKTLFLNAARAGDNDRLLHCLASGHVEIDITNANGLTALHLASKEGRTIVVSELLRRGANINAASKKGNTPLHTASLAGKLDVVRILVESGANVNIQSQHGFTPLYMASQENHVDVIKFLLANNAKPDITTEDGFTPLAVAVQQGHAGVVDLLANNNSRDVTRGVATPTATAASRGRSQRAQPPLHVAARKDDVKAAGQILQNAVGSGRPAEKWNLIHEATKNGFTALHVAARYGNHRIAGLFIEYGADVNFTAKNSVTALHVASKWGHRSVVRLLLNMGAKMDARTGDDLTALHCAARSGNDAVVIALLERGAPVDARSRNGLSPLHMSAQGDHVDCATQLLGHEAIIDAVTVDNLTPLHIAAHYGYIRMTKLLLDNHCNINALAPNGFTPLHIACKKNHIKVVELLLRYGASLEKPTEVSSSHKQSGLTPLHVAAFMGNQDLITFLLEKGANPNSVTQRGETPLHYAARASRSAVMRQLLDNGAQLDAKSKDLLTALHISARQGDLAGVQLQLDRGATPNVVTTDLNTPLHGAAREGHEEVAALLLDHGANMNLVNKRGFTPLHMAAKFGKLKMAKLLLDKGGDPDIEGKHRLTPLHVATHYGRTDVAQLLLDRKAKPQCAAKNGFTPLHIAAKRNRKEIAAAVLKEGADVNAQSVNGYCPLHLASPGGLADMATLLLNNGANPNCRSKNGLTPMHLCAQEDRVPVAEILEQHGAEIDPQTKAGYTPLHTACHFGQINMIQFLLRHGASVNATTKLGYTPLHQAAQQGQVVVIKALLKHKADTNALTASGQTPLSIAETLGLKPVIDLLKNVTDVVVSPATKKRKFNLAIPETMQEAPMSDWEDEGHSPLPTISEDMEPGQTAAVPSGRQLSPPPRGSEKEVPDSDLDRWTLPAAGKRKSRETSPPRQLQLKHEPTQRWTWSDDDFYDSMTLTPNGKAGLEYSTASLGPRQILDEFRYMNESSMKDDMKYPSEDIMNGSPQIKPKMAKPEFMTPPETATMQIASGRDRQLAPIAENELDTLKPRGKVVGSDGGVVRSPHPQKVRVIVPRGSLTKPAAISCRLILKDRLKRAPHLRRGEAFASRIVELTPSGLQFSNPVVVEVPHFASLRGGEREITVLRSDDGQTWKEHRPEPSTKDESGKKAILDVIKATPEDVEGPSEEICWDRLTHITTRDLPQYFALVTRVHQQKAAVGPKGAIIQSDIDPHASVIVPRGAVPNGTPVKMEVLPIPKKLVSEVFSAELPSLPSVSPIVSVEPLSGAFYEPVTVTLPYPTKEVQPADKPEEVPKLHLIAGTTEKADGPTCWTDVTDAVPLSLADDEVSFKPAVASIKYMLMACPESLSEMKPVEEMAASIHDEAIKAPFLGKFVVFGKRLNVAEGQLKVYCLSDQDLDDVKAAERENGFEEVAHSDDVEVFDDKPQLVELTGNLAPVVDPKQPELSFPFRPFQISSLPMDVRVPDVAEDATGCLILSRAPPESAKDLDALPKDITSSAKEGKSAARVVEPSTVTGKPETVAGKPDSRHKHDLITSPKDGKFLPTDVKHSPAVGRSAFGVEPMAVDGKPLPGGGSPQEESAVPPAEICRLSITLPDKVHSESFPGLDKDRKRSKARQQGAAGDDEYLPPDAKQPKKIEFPAEEGESVPDVLPLQVAYATKELSRKMPMEPAVQPDSFEESIMPEIAAVARSARPMEVDEEPILSGYNAPRSPGGQREIEGDIQSRQEVTEDQQALDDGSTVKRQVIMTTYFKPVTEFPVTGKLGQQPSVREKIVGVDVEENVVCLPPGVVEPYASNVEVDVNTEKFEDFMPDGALLTKTVTTLSVHLKDEEDPRNDGRIAKRKLPDSKSFRKPKSAVERMEDLLQAPENTSCSPDLKSGAEQSRGGQPTVKLGPIEQRTDVKEDEHTQPDGATIKHRVTTTQHVAPMLKVSSIDGRPTEEQIGEKLVATDVDEVVTRLAPGILYPYGTGIESESTEDHFEDMLPDGSLFKKKLVNIDVRKCSPEDLASESFGRPLANLGDDGLPTAQPIVQDRPVSTGYQPGQATKKLLDGTPGRLSTEQTGAIPGSHYPVYAVEEPMIMDGTSVPLSHIPPRERSDHFQGPGIGMKPFYSTPAGYQPGQATTKPVITDGTPGRLPTAQDVAFPGSHHLGYAVEEPMVMDGTSVPLSCVPPRERSDHFQGPGIGMKPVYSTPDETYPSASSPMDTGDFRSSPPVGRAADTNAQPSSAYSGMQPIQPTAQGVPRGGLASSSKDSKLPLAAGSPLSPLGSGVADFPKSLPAAADAVPRKSVKEYRRGLPNGAAVIRKVTTTQYVQPLAETPAAALATTPSVTKIPEQIVGTEVEESIIKLPAGTIEPGGCNVQCDIAVQHSNETQPDGTPLARKVVVANVQIKPLLEEEEEVVVSNPTVLQSKPRSESGRFVEGEEQSRLKSLEDHSTLDDGTAVTKKTTETEFFKPLFEVRTVGGKEIRTPVGEEILRVESLQNILEIRPGVVEPYGSNVTTDVTVDAFDEKLPNDVPVKRKVVKLVVSPIDTSLPEAGDLGILTPGIFGVTPEPDSSIAGLGESPVLGQTEPTARQKDAMLPLGFLAATEEAGKVPVLPATSGETKPSVIPTGWMTIAPEDPIEAYLMGPKPRISVVRKEGAPVAKIDVIEDEQALPDGGLLKHKLVTTTNVRPVEEVTVIDNLPTTPVVHDEIVDRQIDETFTLLPPGVTQPVGVDLESDTVVEKLDAAVVDGVPERKTITRTTVHKNPMMPPEVTYPDGPTEGSTVKRTEGAPIAHTEITEDQTELPDGGLLNHRVKAVTHAVPVEEVPLVNGEPSGPPEIHEEIIGKDIEETFTHLPCGVTDPSGPDVDCETVVEKLDDKVEDGVPVRKIIKRRNVRKKPISYPIETSIAGPVPGSFIRRTEGEPFSRTEASEDQRVLPDGDTLKHRVVAVTHIKPIEEVTFTDGKPSEPRVHEEIFDKEVNETFTKLPPGVNEPTGNNLDVTKEVEKLDDAVINGVLVKKTITKITAQKKQTKSHPLEAFFAGHVPESSVKRTEGQPIARTEITEDKHVLPDGRSVKHRVVTVTHLKPIEEITIVDGQPSEPVVHDEIIDKEIEETITKLPPGVTEPVGIGLERETFLEKLDDAVVDGVLVKKTITRINVCKKPEEDIPAAATECIQGSTPGTTIKRTEGSPVARTEISEDQHALPDAGLVKHRTVTVTNVKPVEEVKIVNGKPSDPVVHEEIINKEIEETFTTLPPGVTEPTGHDLESQTVVEKLKDAVIDGVLTKKTVKRTNVHKKPKVYPIESEVKGPVRGSYVKRTEGQPIARTAVQEDEKVLPDGDKLKHKTVTVTRFKPIQEVTFTDGKPSAPVLHEEIVDKEINETFTKLPPGVTEISGIGVESETVVEKLDDTIVDGILVKKSVKRITVQKKPEPTAVVSHIDGHAPGSSVQRTEGAPCSKSEITEDTSVLPDGSTLKHRTAVVTNFKPVEEITFTNGQPSAPVVHEKVIDKEIEEAFTKLPPGVAETSGIGIECETVVEKLPDAIVYGILVKKTVKKTKVTKKPEEAAPVVEYSNGPTPGTVIKRSEGPPVARTEITESKKNLPDGGTLEQRTVTVTHVRPIEEVTISNGITSEPVIHEEIIDKEIEDSFTKLPKGVTKPSGIGIESQTEVEKLDDAIVDGVLVKKTVKRTTASRRPEGKPVAKFVNGPLPEVTFRRTERAPVARTEVSKDQTNLRDGGTQKHKTVTVTHIRPIEEVAIVGDKAGIPVMLEEVIDKVIEESFTKLPPGVTQPSGIGLESETVVEKIPDAIVDGILVKKTVKKTKVTKKPEEAAPVKEQILKGPTPGSIIKRKEGAPVTRTEVAESKSDLPDGGTLEHKTVTVTHVKPVEEVTISNGQPSEPVVYEEILDKEIEENFTKLPKGVTQPAGIGLESETVVEKLDDTVIDGVPIRKTVKKTTVVKKLESKPVVKFLLGPTPDITVKRTEGEPITRTEVTKETSSIPDGSSVKHKTVTVTHLQPVEEVTVTGGQPGVPVLHEEIIDKIIEESFTKMPPGVTQPYGIDLESETVVENVDDQVVDGVLTKKTIKRTTIQKKSPSPVIDAANAAKKVMADTEVPSLAQINHLISPEENPQVKFVHAGIKPETPKLLLDGVEPKSAKGVDANRLTSPDLKDKDIKAKTGVVEYQCCLDDGTVIRRIVAVTKNYVPEEIKLVPLQPPEYIPEKIVSVEIDENVLALPPGLISPNGDNCKALVNIQSFNKALNDGTPVKKTVATILVSLKEPSGGRPVGPRIVEGKIEARTHVLQDHKSLDDGSMVRRKVITTIRVQPITKLTIADDGTEEATLLREKIIDAEIEENVLELPPGVIEPYGSNSDTDIVVSQFDDTLPDGTLAKHKVVKMTVRLKNPIAGGHDGMTGLEEEDGEVHSVTDTAEFEESLDDGTTIMRKVITTKHIKEPGSASKRLVGSPALQGKIVGIDVEENILQLPPGVIEPFARNCENQISVDNSEDTRPDGVVVKRKVVKMIVRLKHPVVDETVPKEAAQELAASPQHTTKVLAVSPEAEHTPVMKTVEGDVVNRVDVKESEKTLPDGTLVRTWTETTKTLRPITDVTVLDGVPMVTSYREEVVGANILENVVRLGPGVTEPIDETSVTASTTIVKSEEKLPDGTVAPKTIKTTSYQSHDAAGKPGNPSPTQKVKDGTVDETVPTEAAARLAAPQHTTKVLALTPEAEHTPVIKTVEGDVVNRVDVKESEKTLPDGTLVRTRTETTKRLKPITVVTVLDGVPTATSYREEVVGANILENTVRLGPGVTEPIDETSVTASTSVVKSEEKLPDGTVAPKTIKTTSYQNRDGAGRPGNPSLTQKVIEGTVEARTSVTEDQKILDDGTTVKTRISTTRFVKPVRFITKKGDVVTESSVKDELVATEVDERITELAPGISEPYGANVHTTTSEENFDELSPDGKPQKRKVTRVKAILRNPTKGSKKLVTRKVRRIGPDGELIEEMLTEEDDDMRSPASSRRSSTSEGPLMSPTDLSPSNSELDLTTVGVYADVVEGEPNIETDVQEYEDTLPDSTVVKKRVITTTETKTVLMRALMPDDDAPEQDEVEAAPISVIRYTDVTEDAPQTVTDIYDTAESMPDGEMNRQRIRTTGRRRLTTERKLISGRLDEDQFQGIGLNFGEGQSSADRSEDSGTRRADELRSPFDADISSRLVLRKHVHKKTIIHGGKEETLVTETTHVEQDSEPPPDMSASIEHVIKQFMASDSFGNEHLPLTGAGGQQNQ